MTNQKLQWNAGAVEDILGYSVATEMLDSHISKICGWIEQFAAQKYFVCANPHSLVVAGSDNLFRESISNADIIVPDGIGVVLASKILMGSIKKRITGMDVFINLNKALNDRGNVTCFFMGATQETLDRITRRMQHDFPNVTIVGTYSPPFKYEFDDEDNELMIDMINRATPDVLWIGMTAPKQEKWIFTNKDRLQVKFIGAIGAVFDFYSGNIKRPHPILQRMGLEWLARLLKEPRRLWRRTFISNFIFSYRVVKQKYSKFN